MELRVENHMTNWNGYIMNGMDMFGSNGGISKVANGSSNDCNGAS